MKKIKITETQLERIQESIQGEAFGAPVNQGGGNEFGEAKAIADKAVGNILSKVNPQTLVGESEVGTTTMTDEQKIAAAKAAAAKAGIQTVQDLRSKSKFTTFLNGLTAALGSTVALGGVANLIYAEMATAGGKPLPFYIACAGFIVGGLIASINFKK